VYKQKSSSKHGTFVGVGLGVAFGVLVCEGTGGQSPSKVTVISTG
jgi:hypothetical protein